MIFKRCISSVSYTHLDVYKRQYELHPFWEVGNTDVITQFLLKNKGISFLPEYVVQDYLKNGQLVILNTECPAFIMWSQIVYHRNKYVTPQMNLFLKLMLKHVRK